MLFRSRAAGIVACSENVTKQGRIRFRGSTCTAAYKRKRDTREARAARERSKADAGNARRDCDAHEAHATIERTPADAGQLTVRRKSHRFKSRAARERPPADAGHTFGNRDRSQRAASFKSANIYFNQRWGQFYLLQIVTSTKSSPANTFN